MYLVRSVFYWASQGCPEALPAGMIAINMHSCINLNDDVKEVSNMLCSIGIFDDTCWQLGFTKEDVDLISRDTNDSFQTLSNDQIVTKWQWEAIKEKHDIRLSEHDFKDYLDFIDPEERPAYKECLDDL